MKLSLVGLARFANFTRLTELLSNTTPSGHRSIETAKRFYAACEDDLALARSWRQALDDALRAMGGWPVAQRAGASQQGPPPDPAAGRERLARLYGQLSLNFSQDSLFKFSVGADDRNSSNQVFQVRLSPFLSSTDETGQKLSPGGVMFTVLP